MDILKDKVSKSAYKNINLWLTDQKYAEYRSELGQMIQDEKWQELEDSFFKVIEFGTAGRRGTTGIGSNRINRVTIGESTQALCSYALSFDPEAGKKGLVIAYDTRLTSPELSRYTACVAAANGFKVYIFENFRATPELSFAVRHLGCAVGVVVSASHNPPADNGFKAYWSDGGQVASPHDKGILEEATRISEIKALPDFDQAVQDGLIEVVGEKIDEAYLANTVAQSVGEKRSVKIVYSPLHGAGQTNALPTLQKAGFNDIVTVEEQMVPDGNFPTVPGGKANPEEIPANKMAVDLLLETGADIAITNDPDADRIGVIDNHHGEPYYLSGNQSASLAADYILQQMKAMGELTTDHFLVKTIVTTDLLNAIASKYSVKIYDNLLVGFKYIAEVIRNRQAVGEKFIMGAEESFGLLKGDYARDKDGATGALPLAELAAELKVENKTLTDRLFELYREHGVYFEKIKPIEYPGAEGFKTMTKILDSLRQNSPSEIGGEQVSATLDYVTQTKRLATGETEVIDCATGNVLVFEFGDRRKRITIRPSGTEPKIKMYFQWYSETDNPEQTYGDLSQKIEKIYEDFSDLALSRANS